jgi:hypothetical protein
MSSPQENKHLGLYKDMSFNNKDNDWNEYKELILSELERINKQLETINEKFENIFLEEIVKLKVDIAMLQIKSGIFGALTGAVTTLILFLVNKHFLT